MCPTKDWCCVEKKTFTIQEALYLVSLNSSSGSSMFPWTLVYGVLSYKASIFCLEFLCFLKKKL